MNDQNAYFDDITTLQAINDELVVKNKSFIIDDEPFRSFFIGSRVEKNSTVITWGNGTNITIPSRPELSLADPGFCVEIVYKITQNETGINLLNCSEKAYSLCRYKCKFKFILMCININMFFTEF